MQMHYRLVTGKKSCGNKRYYFININITLKKIDYVANFLSLSGKMK